MPFMAVPILVNVVPFQVAIAMMVVPTITANLQLAWGGGRITFHLKRFMGLLIPMLLVIPFAVQILIRIEQKVGLFIIGIIAIIFVLSQLLPLKLVILPERERWLSPVVGVSAGLVCGLSGFYGPVLIPYLLALRISRDEFVAALSLIYLCGSLALNSTLAGVHVLTWEIFSVSLVGGLLVSGMILIGSKVRAAIEEERYRKLVLGLLLLMGCDLIRRALT